MNDEPHHSKYTKPDLIVVGGGAVGLTTAYMAAKRGLKVLLLDKSEVGSRASWAGAGMLNCHTWPRGDQNPDYHDLLYASIGVHRELSVELKEATGIDVGFRNCGALELFSHKRLARKKNQNDRDRLLEGAKQRKIAASYLMPDDVKKLEPNANIEGLDSAVQFPEDCQIRNPWFLKAVAAACKQLGVEIKENTAVRGLEFRRSQAKGVWTEDGHFMHAPKVVICMGAWTTQLPKLHNLVAQLHTLHPVRGQIACFQTEEKPCSHLLTVGAKYIVPRDDGIVLVGSTMEAVGYTRETTPAAIAELHAFGAKLLPQLSDLKPFKCWADVRPGIRGQHPVLGPVPNKEGLYIAAGHFRNGLSLSAITGKIMSAMFVNEDPPLDVTAWLPVAPN